MIVIATGQTGFWIANFELKTKVCRISSTPKYQIRDSKRQLAIALIYAPWFAP
jgi:hypothetical protein